MRSSTSRRAALRRVFALAIAIVLVAGGPATLKAADPASLHEAVLYHLDFATDIDGTPVDEGDTFVEGVPRVLTLVGWDFVPAGTELRVRVYNGTRLVYDDTRTVTREQTGGFVFNYQPDGGVPAGTYAAQLDYNGVPDEVAAFTVLPPGGQPVAAGSPGAAGSSPAPSGTAAVPRSPILSGPVPYARPADVLVVTRASVLRSRLGTRADAVLAAAARVGTVRDLEADGVTRDTPETAIPEVHRLLLAGSYRYLLILGNDDAVPFAHLPNPVADEEREILDSWELPVDWVPSDNPYTDLDGDDWGIPDIAVARIPSSDDADLLLTQLGENVPPEGGAFALINQKRRTIAAAILGTIDDSMSVDARYAPPTSPDEIASTTAGRARFTYVLLHGIGVTTDEWATDIVAWSPEDLSDLTGQWVVKSGGEATAITVGQAGVHGGIVEVGACYGGWTLDTIEAPTHKTAANSLALAYLRSGTRAFIADTHISYSALIGADGTPVARTGFELLFWRALLAGASPIDAFQTAKVGIGHAIDSALAAGDTDSAVLDFKTLEIMIYLGRP
jgi:hypothetical protein